MVVVTVTGGPSSSSYSNEGNVLEPNPQVMFYSSNYACLKTIKAIYDLNDLFIVPTGVCSEYWDADGMCTINYEERYSLDFSILSVPWFSLRWLASSHLIPYIS